MSNLDSISNAINPSTSTTPTLDDITGTVSSALDSLTNGTGNVDFNKDAVTVKRGAAVGGPTYGSLFNIQQGAQLGIGPRVVAMDGGTPLPLNCAMVYVLQAPRFWDRFPVAQKTYKTLTEMHMTSIDNIDLNYTAEFSDVEVGHDGQVASMPLMVKRAPISPSATMNEIGGNLGWNLHYMWLKHTSHPDTCASLLSALYEDTLEQWVWSTFTASWLVVQPDPTGLPGRIVDAAVITNIFPQETGNLGVKRTIGQAEVPKRTFSYKAIWTHSESTRELGRLATIACGAHSVNLDYALTYNGVRANIGDMGHYDWMGQAIDNGMVDKSKNPTASAQAEESTDISTASKQFAEALNDYGILGDTASSSSIRNG